MHDTWRQNGIDKGSELRVIVDISIGHERIVLVQEVVRLKSDLHVYTLSELCILKERHVGAEVSWPGEVVPAGVSPTDLIVCKVVDASGSGIASNWVLKRVYVEDCPRRPVRVRISDNISNGRASATSTVAYHREVLPGRTVENHVQLPAAEYLVGNTTGGRISLAFPKGQIVQDAARKNVPVVKRASWRGQY